MVNTIAIIIVLNRLIHTWVLISENSNYLSKYNANFKGGCLGNALAHGNLRKTKFSLSFICKTKQNNKSMSLEHGFVF